MADKQISQFTSSTPVDTDIFHGKKQSGEDVKISFLNVANEVLSRVPAQTDIIDRTLAASETLEGFIEYQLESGGEYKKITLASLRTIFTKADHPIGSVYINHSNPTNPSTLLGFGTWSAFAQGRVPIGVGTSVDVNGTSKTFAAAESSGEYSHQLTIGEMPSHSHSVNLSDPDSVYPAISADNGGGSGDVYTMQTASQGSGFRHNNVQPYVTVYMWVRVA